MKDMVASIGIKEFMSTLNLPKKGSNRGYEPMQIIECPNHAGKTTLNISAIGERQKWLDGLFDIVRTKDSTFYFSNA